MVTRWFIHRELVKGDRILDESGNELGYSKRAALKAIVQTVFSRIAIAAPVMREHTNCTNAINCNKFTLFSICFYECSFPSCYNGPAGETKSVGQLREM